MDYAKLYREEQERKAEQNRRRQAAFRERQRAKQGPSRGHVYHEACNTHAAIVEAAASGNAWALQVVGQNQFETLRNLAAYARAERGRLFKAEVR